MLNVACIMGRLTADPELRYTQGNTAVVRITLACNRPTRAGSEEQTDFIDVTAWGKTAEFVSRYFHKGQLVAVDGSIIGLICNDFIADDVSKKSELALKDIDTGS